MECVFNMEVVEELLFFYIYFGSVRAQSFCWASHDGDRAISCFQHTITLIVFLFSMLSVFLMGIWLLEQVRDGHLYGAWNTCCLETPRTFQIPISWLLCIQFNKQTKKRKSWTLPSPAKTGGSAAFVYKYKTCAWNCRSNLHTQSSNWGFACMMAVARH